MGSCIPFIDEQPFAERVKTMLSSAVKGLPSALSGRGIKKVTSPSYTFTVAVGS